MIDRVEAMFQMLTEQELEDLHECCLQQSNKLTELDFNHGEYFRSK